MPLNLDETTLPLQNPTLRQCLESAATARPRAVDSSLGPRNPSQDVAPVTPGSLVSWGAAGGQQAASLGSPSQQKNVGFVLWEMQQRSKSKRQLWLQASPTHSHGKVT